MTQPAVKLSAPAPQAPQRDALGRFLEGNSLGKGNPFARRSAALRKAFYDAITPEDMREMAETLVREAKAGDWVAAGLLMRWILGKSPELIVPYQLMVRVAALEVLELIRGGFAKQFPGFYEFLGRHCFCPKIRLNAKFVHFMNEADHVVTDELAAYLIHHGDVRFTPDAVAELSFDHTEGRFHATASMIMLQEFIAAKGKVVKHLRP